MKDKRSINLVIPVSGVIPVSTFGIGSRNDLGGRIAAVQKPKMLKFAIVAFVGWTKNPFQLNPDSCLAPGLVAKLSKVWCLAKP